MELHFRAVFFILIMKTRLHRAALLYASIGWHVIPDHEPIFANGVCVGCTCEAWRRRKQAERGEKPDFVCKRPGKHPRISNWIEKATTDIAQINRWWGWWPNANVAISAGASGLVAVDVDSYKEGGYDLEYETVTNITGGGGMHKIFLHPDIKEKLGNSAAGLPKWIDVKAHGGKFTAPPSMHRSGNLYSWADGRNPLDIMPTALPDEILQPLVDAIHEKEMAILNRKKYTARTVKEQDVADALSFLPPTGDYHDYWLKILMSVHSEFPDETGVQLVESWSPGSNGEVAEKFKSFNGDGVSIGTLFFLAKQHGWTRAQNTYCEYDEV